MWAKQSTAATLIIGPILDSSGAEYTSAVIGDLSISKNGGTLTALASAATLTHIANGQYTLVMTTGNLDTLGRLQITCNKSTYQMPPVGLNIVPADRYDSLVLGTDRFDANVTHVADTSQTAGDIYASQVAIAGYIDTEVGAIKTKTDQLTFTTSNKVDSTAVLDSTRQQALADLAAMITGSGTADAKFDALALSLAPGGGALTGPFTRTITVTDAADDAPIEAANVRLYRTGETETKPTDADGEASFTTEAATFSYAVTANGYGGVSGTIVISADGATTIELTATSVTPPTDPALSAIEVLCLNANFAATAGIDIDFRMSAVATGDQNRAHPGAKKTVTSNVSGIARFEGPQGATIEWKRGTGQVWTAVTLDNDSVTNVTSLIGSP